MAIIKYDPFKDLDKFFEEDIFTPVFAKVTTDLPVDIYEEDNNVVVEMQIPGIDVKNIDVSIEDNYLRVSGSREEEKEEKKKNYYRKEIKKGSFERIVRLPVEVVGDKAGAEYKDGVLKVTIPKTKESKAKKIAVRVK